MLFFICVWSDLPILGLAGLFAAIAANTPCVAVYAAHTAAEPPRYWQGGKPPCRQYAGGFKCLALHRRDCICAFALVLLRLAAPLLPGAVTLRPYWALAVVHLQLSENIHKIRICAFAAVLLNSTSR